MELTDDDDDVVFQAVLVFLVKIICTTCKSETDKTLLNGISSKWLNI